MPKRRSKTSNKAEDTEIETATDYDASATEYRKQIEQLKSLTEAFSKRGKISLDEKLQLLYEVVMNLYNNMELQMDQAFKILLLDARVVQLETLTENLRPEFSAFNKELDELEEIEEETDNKEEIEEETDVKEEIEEETDKQVEIQILPELQVAPPPTAKAEPIDSKIPPALKKAAANLSGIKSETILAKVPPTSKTAPSKLVPPPLLVKPPSKGPPYKPLEKPPPPPGAKRGIEDLKGDLQQELERLKKIMRKS